MSKKEFKNVAPWTTEEKILSPTLLVIAVAGLLLGFGVIPWEGMSQLGWTVGVPMIFVALLAFFTSYNRKKKSTLFTTVNGNKLHVWMRKPSKVRWNERLDEGKNAADLTDLDLIAFEEVYGTKLLRLHTMEKFMIVPWRLVGAETEAGEAIRALVADRLENGRKMKFQDEATEKSIRAWVAGGELRFVEPATRKIADYSKMEASTKSAPKKPKNVAPVAVPVAKESAPEEAPVAVEDLKPRTHIGYQKYTQAAHLDDEALVAQAVEVGIAKVEVAEEEKVKEEEVLPGYAGNLLLGDSITIDLSEEKK